MQVPEFHLRIHGSWSERIVVKIAKGYGASRYILCGIAVSNLCMSSAAMHKPVRCIENVSNQADPLFAGLAIDNISLDCPSKFIGF